MKKLTPALTLVALVAALALAGTPSAYACGSPPPPQPPITVDFHEVCFDLDDPTKCMIKAWVTIHNYTTFGSSGNNFCSCALRKVPKIKKVLYARFVDPATGKRYPSFFFDDSAAVGANAGAAWGSGIYDGFLTPNICDAIPAGTPLDLMFDVLLEGGTMLPTWLPNIQINGLAATAEADASGNFIGHLGFVDNSPTPGNCLIQKNTRAFLNGAEFVHVQRTGDSTFLADLKACPFPAPDGEVPTAP